MNTPLWHRWLISLACAGSCIGFCTGTANAEDLREAAPPGAFMAVYGKHNPDRDYQRAHYHAVWDEVEKSKILEKLLQIAQSKMAEGDAEQFIEVRDAVRDALAPIEWDKLMKTSEVMFAQKFEGPSSVQLFMLRVPDGGAESLKQGIVNLFNLVANASQGKLPVVTDSVAGVEMTYLQFPPEMPITFQPAVGVKDEIVVLTTSMDLASEGLELLANPSEESKFDDPRVIAALAQLPEAEDSIVFFDGKAMAEQLQGITTFIQDASDDDPNAQRFIDLFSDFLHQLDAVDFEVTVEYTDGFQNRTAAFGALASNSDRTVLGRMLGKQQLFDDWTLWVPSETTGFSLTAGATLLPLYEWAMETIPETFPEAQQHLDQFAALQNQFDLHLKEDLLEAFSGEMASITLPGNQWVFFTRCSRPERIQELLHRGINAANELPHVKGQGIGLQEVPGLDGFEELTAAYLALTQIRPVIGFRDGWMIIGTHKEAVETALATQAGEATSWSESDRFKEFNLEVEGAVHSISYTNTAENTKALAQGLQQAGFYAPMVIGMAQARPEGQGGPDLQVVQDLLGLLPSVGRIIAKFDFLEATLSVAQAGKETGTYTRNTVTLIRPPNKEEPESDEPAPAKASPKKSKGR